jgi:uncharacterized membrane protein YgcG
MFDKLFNLFRKKPEASEPEFVPTPNPSVPSPLKKKPSCGCSGKYVPHPRAKPERERDYTPVLDSVQDIAYIAADAIAHNPVFQSRPYEHNSLPAEAPDPTPHNHSYDSPSHSHSYDSHSSHSSHSSYDSGHSSSSYDSGSSCDSGGCDGGGGGCD